MKTNWHVDNHCLTLSTRWSYQFDDDMLPRCGFETFGTGVPKISASVIRKIFSATVKYTVYLRRSEYSTQPIMKLCEPFMMMLLTSMAEKFHMTLPT